jgi:hypothetical protein
MSRRYGVAFPGRDAVAGTLSLPAKRALQRRLGDALGATNSLTNSLLWRALSSRSTRAGDRIACRCCDAAAGILQTVCDAGDAQRAVSG